jgi:hypothetical protein
MFARIQQQKKTHNQMVNAKKLADEVQDLINNLPSARTRT